MLDRTIDHAHRQAEAMERDAKQIDDRLAALGVPADWMKRRRGLGQLRNPYSTAFRNLTAQAILEQKDRSLLAAQATAVGQGLNTCRHVP